MNQELEPNNTQKQDDEGSPKFGRLLIILIFVVIFIGILTFATEAYYRHNPIG